MTQDCCNPRPMTVATVCASSPPQPPISEWVTTTECEGNVVLKVPCPPVGPEKTCVRIAINDTGSLPTEHWEFQFVIGCDTHTLRICNPKSAKNPLTVAEYAAYFQQAFLSAPFLLGAGIRPTLLSATGTHSVEFQFCPGKCSLSAAIVSHPPAALTTVSISALPQITAAKAGAFVSYSVTATGVSLIGFDPTKPYAGFYPLPPAPKKGECCEPIVSCCGPQSDCCTVRRTGLIKIKLAQPATLAALQGTPSLVQDAMGAVLLVPSGTPPAGFAEIPRHLYSLILTPSTVGAGTIEVVLH